MITTLSHAAMLIGVFALAGMLDSAWLTYGRPILERRLGWPPVEHTERIPTAAWIGAGCVAATFLAVTHIGAATGF